MDWSPIITGFARRQDEILDRNLTTSLPETLIQARTAHLKKRKQSDSVTNSSTSKKTERSQKHSPPNRKDPSQAVTNPRINSDWRLPDNTTFKACFIDTKLVNEAPQHNQTPFCLQFHIRGTCSRGANCTLIHEDPRDLHLDRKFTAFVKRAIQESRKSTKKDKKSDDDTSTSS
jgi:hypothetical protein